MKKIAATILLLAFTAQTFSQGMIIFNFYLNRSSIKSQCINRYRPLLHCDGKCQLAKKLKQEEKKDQQNQERKLENKSEVFSTRCFIITGLSSLPLVDHVYGQFPDIKTVDRSFAVFHPPSLLGLLS